MVLAVLGCTAPACVLRHKAGGMVLLPPTPSSPVFPQPASVRLPPPPPPPQTHTHTHTHHHHYHHHHHSTAHPSRHRQVGPVTNLALPDVASIGSTPVCKPGSSGALTAGASARGAGGGDPLAAWDYRQTAAVQQRRRTSFRSIKEAVAAARDGDRIILRRGIHNGMGCGGRTGCSRGGGADEGCAWRCAAPVQEQPCPNRLPWSTHLPNLLELVHPCRQAITLNKRVMIEGEGALGEATIDQRANVPTFRIVRCVVDEGYAGVDNKAARCYVAAAKQPGSTLVTPHACQLSRR